MPKFLREDVDAIHALLTVTLEKSDYADKFNTELATYKKQAQLKGFRKGKTPDSVIRKMYGKGLLANIVNTELEKALFGYLEEQNIDFLGQPLSAEDHEDISFDPANLGTFNFKFDIGLVPQFELQGISGTDRYDYYVIEVEENLIDEDLNYAARQKGELKDTDTVGEDHTITLLLEEMEANALKPEGISYEAKVFTGALSESAMAELKGKKTSDVLVLNPFELEKETSEANTRKFLLGLDPDDDREVGTAFQATIQQIQHMEPAALDQAIFDAMFGEGVVEGEAGAREFIRNSFASAYAVRSNFMLLLDVQERLPKLHQFELPEKFLKRWLRVANENMSEKRLEEGFANFVDGLRWSLIRDKIAQTLQVAVSEDEVKMAIRERVSRMYRQYGLPDDLVEKLADRMLESEDRKQVDETRQELFSMKLSAALSATLNLNKINVSLVDFTGRENEKVAALKSAAASQLMNESDEEE
ncbi:MAG: trigger factor [Saprospiraceae bacterium]|nr:trigger factor [Saprospiraceae bacterium]MDZ4705832.1 trigger factor [Saprospiraceae bacterium]